MLILPSSFSKPEVTSPEETVSSCTSKEADLILESNSSVREWLTTRMESMSMLCCVVGYQIFKNKLDSYWHEGYMI